MNKNSNISQQNRLSIVQQNQQQFENKWLFDSFNISLQSCLSSTRESKTYKVLSLRNQKKQYKCLKIIQIEENNLDYITKTIEYANYYIVDTPGYGDSNGLIQYRYKKLQKNSNYLWLFIISKYYKGLSLYDQITINNRIPFKHNKQDFKNFIINSIILLNKDQSSGHIIPTLDRIYLNNQKLQYNWISFQIKMFLQNKIDSILPKKFKHLYLLLPSNIQIFNDQKLMKEYLKQKIKIKGFFLLLYCYLTGRVPDLLGSDYNGLSQKDLEIGQIRNYNSKVSNLVAQSPERWRNQLNSTKNIHILTHYSTQIFGEQNYLSQQLKKVFVQEENISWSTLFSQKSKFRNIFYKNNSLQEKKNKQLKPLFQLNDLKYKKKVNSIKKSFIKFSKYLIFDKFKLQKSSREKIYFDIFFPLKFNLDLKITLQYSNWFQIFFTQNNCFSKQIYFAARSLKQFIQINSQLILRRYETFKLKIKRQNLRSNLYQQTLKKHINFGDLEKIMFVLELKLNQLSDQNCDGMNGLPKYNMKIEEYLNKFTWRQLFPRLFNELFTKKSDFKKLQADNSFKNHYIVGIYDDLRIFVCQFDLSIESFSHSKSVEDRRSDWGVNGDPYTIIKNRFKYLIQKDLQKIKLNQKNKNNQSEINQTNVTN